MQLMFSLRNLVKSVEVRGGKKWKVSLHLKRKSNSSLRVVVLAEIFISISTPKYPSSAGSCVCSPKRCLRGCWFSCCGPGAVMNHEGKVSHEHEEKKNQLRLQQDFGNPDLPYWCPAAEQVFHNENEQGFHSDFRAVSQCVSPCFL